MVESLPSGVRVRTQVPSLNTIEFLDKVSYASVSVGGLKT